MSSTNTTEQITGGMRVVATCQFPVSGSDQLHMKIFND